MVPHPSVLTEWADDMKQRPDYSYIEIVHYLVLSEGVDGRELRSYKSTEAYNYLHSNTIGKVLLRKHSKFIFLKAAVAPSHSGQSYNCKASGNRKPPAEVVICHGSPIGFRGNGWIGEEIVPLKYLGCPP